MAQKRINNLDSLMIFTGANAQNNALALENRQYDSFSDEYIGTLNMTRSFDSIFTNTPSEIFVETTPKYKSIKDITEIAYAYINNKSVIKPSNGTNMYIDGTGVLNFLYDYNDSLGNNLDNGKTLPLSDINLYLRSLNNAMYNRQKYYSKSKEVESISNVGVKYFWHPEGNELNVYNEDTQSTYKLNLGNDYFTYSIKNVLVQDTIWDTSTNTYTPIFDNITTYSYNDAGELVEETTKEPRMVNKNVLEYANPYSEILSNKLDNFAYDFMNSHNEKLLTYYLYDYNSMIPMVMNTYSFGQNTVNVNINYDGEFNNWFHNRISFNVENLESTDLIKITPGENYWFNLAINENERFVGEDKESSDEILFKLENLDNNSFKDVSILSPYKIKKLDFSAIAGSLTGELDLLCQYNKKINYKDTISTNWDLEKGNMLEELIIGKEGINCKLSSINGLENFKNIKKIDLTGCNNLISTPDLSNLDNLDSFILSGSNVSVFKPSDNSVISEAILDDKTQSIILNNIEFRNSESLKYNINQDLTTLELNNVKGIDTLDFVEQWISALETANKLDKGLVNYVNINGVDWDYVSFDTLTKLKQIEINEFTGDLKVCGKGFGYEISRKEYQTLVNLYGQNSVITNEDTNSDLKLKVVLAPHAYDVKLSIIEEYDETSEQQNEYGEWEIIHTTKEREYTALTLNIYDTVVGNSLLDSIVDNKEDQFTHVSRSQFVNNNGIEIGWTLLLNEPLILPTKSEKPKELHIGDILLYNKNTIVFVFKNIENINQNFTKIGEFESVDDLTNLLGHKFEMNYFYSLLSIEEEIEPLVLDENNVIEVEYKNIDKGE